MKKLTLLLSFLVLLLIIGLSLFSFFWLDDFGNLFRLRSNNTGVFESAINFYLNWDGRNISLAGLWKFFSIKYLPIEIITTIYAICLILSCFLVIQIVKRFILVKLTKIETFLLSITIVITAFLGFHVHISETVYWAGGGYYILSSLLFLFFVYLCLSFRDELKSPFVIIAMFVFSIAVGMLSPNLSVGLFALIIFYIFLNYNELKKPKFFYFLLLFGIGIGTIIIVLAPGNFLRASHSNNSFHFTTLSVLKDTVLYLKFSLSLSKILILLLITTILFFLFSYKYEIKLNKVARFKENILFSIKKSLPFLTAAIATILPFLFLRGFYPARAAIFFQFFIIIGFLIFSINLIDSSFFKKKVVSLKKLYIVLISFYIAFILFMMPIYMKSYSLKAEMIQREDLLTSNKGKNITIAIEPIDDKIKVPFCLKFVDLSEDSSNWSNENLRKYWNVKNIYLKKKHE